MTYLNRLMDATKGIQASAKLVTIKDKDLPKYYANIVEQIKTDNPQYSNYEKSQVKFNYQDDYEFVTKLGRGRYSEVFKATNLLTNKDAVIKILKPGKFKCLIQQ